MELHKSIKPENKYNISINDDYMTYFDKSYKFVCENYKEDFDRIANTKFEEITPEFFFQEYCWCICASGFNAKIVSGFFSRLMECLAPATNFNSSKLSEEKRTEVASAALSVFRNKLKVVSMLETCKQIKCGIKNFGWENYKHEYLNEPDKLAKLPFIGNITKYHLARNIGLLAYMKPDLHLTRMAKHWKFENPITMCETIAKQNNMKIGLVDLVLFYGASHFGSKL